MPPPDHEISADANLVGLFADLHGDYNRVIELRERHPKIDDWLCAGDVVDMFAERHYNEPSLRVMARFSIPSVLGNHENRVRKEGVSAMGEEARAYLSALPFSLHLRWGDRRIRVYHATPTSWNDASLETGEPAMLREALPLATADLFVLGHTHVPFVTQVGGATVVNPGALGSVAERPTYAVAQANGSVEIRDFHRR